MRIISAVNLGYNELRCNECVGWTQVGLTQVGFLYVWESLILTDIARIFGIFGFFLVVILVSIVVTNVDVSI